MPASVAVQSDSVQKNSSLKFLPLTHVGLEVSDYMGLLQRQIVLAPENRAEAEQAYDHQVGAHQAQKGRSTRLAAIAETVHDLEERTIFRAGGEVVKARVVEGAVGKYYLGKCGWVPIVAVKFEQIQIIAVEARGVTTMHWQSGTLFMPLSTESSNLRREIGKKDENQEEIRGKRRGAQEERRGTQKKKRNSGRKTN
ncbi:hypothetical protein BJ912DRAFT_1042165 [Pholiota molesta]|nr:hypothetical protein BJ912DRAFT_1042165 [Pholiota molesta]